MRLPMKNRDNANGVYMSINPNKSTPNTLRLGQRELKAILKQLEQDDKDKGSPDREFVRWSYQVEAVSLVIEHGSGNTVTLPVATRNISRGGISVLHSAFVYTDTPVSIILKSPGGAPLTVGGVVMRCSHLTGRIHEIGIKFDEQISTKDLLGHDPLNEAYSLERVDPARLHGSVLIVTVSDLDRDLMLMFLEDTNLVINTADTIENAVSRAQKGCELIIADFHLGTKTAPELILALSEAGCDMPVVVLTADKSDAALKVIREASAAGILSKPTNKDKLLQATAEFLHADGDGGPLFSVLTIQDSAYPLLTKFLSDVPRMALNLEKAVREDDKEACMNIVRTLSGTAAPLGFPDISNLAIVAERKLADNTPRGASTEIRVLVIACRRIKARPAA